MDWLDWCVELLWAVLEVEFCSELKLFIPKSKAANRDCHCQLLEPALLGLTGSTLCLAPVLVQPVLAQLDFLLS